MAGRCVCPGVDSFWVRPPAVSSGPKIRRYIFQKLDDLDNGATAAIGDDGTVYFNVKKAGIEYKVKTTTGKAIVGQWADCWFVFDSAANSPAIYINNVKYTDASTEALLWNNTHSHTILANYNMGATVGQFRGRMDDFRLYRGALVEDEQVDNFAGNGLTITGGLSSPPNPDEGVFIVNRVKIDKQLEYRCIRSWRCGLGRCTSSHGILYHYKFHCYKFHTLLATAQRKPSALISKLAANAACVSTYAIIVRGVVVLGISRVFTLSAPSKTRCQETPASSVYNWNT